MRTSARQRTIWPGFTYLKCRSVILIFLFTNLVYSCYLLLVVVVIIVVVCGVFTRTSWSSASLSLSKSRHNTQMTTFATTTTKRPTTLLRLTSSVAESSFHQPRFRHFECSPTAFLLLFFSSTCNLNTCPLPGNKIHFPQAKEMIGICIKS